MRIIASTSYFAVHISQREVSYKDIRLKSLAWGYCISLKISEDIFHLQPKRKKKYQHKGYKGRKNSQKSITYKSQSFCASCSLNEFRGRRSFIMFCHIVQVVQNFCADAFRHILKVHVSTYLVLNTDH